MGQVVDFPRHNEKHWHDFWGIAVRQYTRIPGGQEVLEACRPAIRAHWDAMWHSLSVQAELPVGVAPTSSEAELVQAHAQTVANLIAGKLEAQRADLFATLSNLEFRLAYAIRYGQDPY